jgi:hypothetical protein
MFFRAVPRMARRFPLTNKQSGTAYKSGAGGSENL